MYYNNFSFIFLNLLDNYHYTEHTLNILFSFYMLNKFYTKYIYLYYNMSSQVSKTFSIVGLFIISVILAIERFEFIIQTTVRVESLINLIQSDINYSPFIWICNYHSLYPNILQVDFPHFPSNSYSSSIKKNTNFPSIFFRISN